MTSQFVLTSHVIGYDMLIGLEEGLGRPEARRSRPSSAPRPTRSFDANAAKYDAQEKDAIEFFKKEGKQVYTPDQDAFRAFAQKKYLDKYANDWPKGAIERINAIK